MPASPSTTGRAADGSPEVVAAVFAAAAGSDEPALVVVEVADGHAEIATAVVAMARSLGLSTVAEGVATPAQAAALTELGATYLQGFSLARPMDGAATAAWAGAR